MKKRDLRQCERDVYSQNGEDGVIEEILKRISLEARLDHWCVEFGAWDGVYLSNTCRLIREDGYSAVLIEGNARRAEQLQRNFPADKVTALCRFVELDGDNTLENILSDTSLPEDFDFLSIDVDGVDYYIFEGLKRYKPKVVCIEFNPSIPNVVDFVQDRSFNIKQGASAKALVRLAKERGYDLAHTTSCNLIFTRDDLSDLVIDNVRTLEELNLPGNDPTYLFVGYDGSLLSNKDHVTVGWHGFDVPISQLQPLPIQLRIYPGDYGLFHRLLFFSWWTLRNPSLFIRKMKQRLSS